MPSEPNFLPASPAPGSATSFTSAVPGPHLNVAHNTPAARQPQALPGSPRTVQSFSKILSDIGALPSDPDVENAPLECNPPLTGRAFRYQRRDASRVARTKHAGMFDPTDTLSTFDSNEPSIESPAQNSLPSRLPFPYTLSRELHTQHVGYLPAYDLCSNRDRSSALLGRCPIFPPRLSPTCFYASPLQHDFSVTTPFRGRFCRWAFTHRDSGKVDRSRTSCPYGCLRRHFTGGPPHCLQFRRDTFPRPMPGRPRPLEDVDFRSFWTPYPPGTFHFSMTHPLRRHPS